MFGAFVKSLTTPLVVVCVCFCFCSAMASSDRQKVGQSVIDLQKDKKTSTLSTHVDGRDLAIQLTNLNTNINGWYLLELNGEMFNLQNPNVDSVQLRLSEQFKEGLIIENTKDGSSFQCPLWKSKGSSPFLSGEKSFDGVRSDPYFEICNGAVFVRNNARGFKTNKEWVVSRLRNLGTFGEGIINLYKNIEEDADLDNPDAAFSRGAGGSVTPAGLLPAEIDSAQKDESYTTEKLGIEIPGNPGVLRAGAWYPTLNYPGVYVSLIKPKLVSQEILSGSRDQGLTGRVGKFDGEENKALTYLVAYDLSLYEMGWSHGTELPGTGWSERANKRFKEDNPLGPDGFDKFEPLNFPGHVNPAYWSRTVATLSAGFQRMHSAFKHGPLSETRNGNHYGLMEDGVVLSTIMPELATVIVYKNGRTEIKTWTEADNQLLPTIRYIRQNGVPLIERGPNGAGVPGLWVNKWGEGNWSGSADAKLRSARGAACLINKDGHAYFVYAYFSSVTPNAMARVLQAYSCEYAIHLDMNSPIHAYLANFIRQDINGEVHFRVEPLMKDMSVANPQGLPRYVVTPDYRDFFYIMKRP